MTYGIWYMHLIYKIVDWLTELEVNQINFSHAL